MQNVAKKNFGKSYTWKDGLYTEIVPWFHPCHPPWSKHTQGQVAFFNIKTPSPAYLRNSHYKDKIDGFVQDCSISSVLAMEILQYCTKPSRWSYHRFLYNWSRDHFVYAPSQCETILHCNVVSHWLGAYTKWSLLKSYAWKDDIYIEIIPLMQLPLPA